MISVELQTTSGLRDPERDLQRQEYLPFNLQFGLSRRAFHLSEHRCIKNTLTSNVFRGRQALCRPRCELPLSLGSVTAPLTPPIQVVDLRNHHQRPKVQTLGGFSALTEQSVVPHIRTGRILEKRLRFHEDRLLSRRSGQRTERCGDIFFSQCVVSRPTVPAITYFPFEETTCPPLQNAGIWIR